MKYAVKTQLYNPDRPAGMKPEMVWQKISIDDDLAETFTADNWIVSATDDYMQKLLSTPRVVVPESVTPRQARQALLIFGVTTEIVEGAINSLPSPTKDFAMVEWKYSTAFVRNNPLVATMGQMLGWSSASLDALWILASKL